MSEKKSSLVCHLSIPYEFGEVIEVYGNSGLTPQQLFILYNNLIQVKVKATLIENGKENSVNIEVVDNE